MKYTVFIVFTSTNTQQKYKFINFHSVVVIVFYTKDDLLTVVSQIILFLVWYLNTILSNYNYHYVSIVSMKYIPMKIDTSTT